MCGVLYIYICVYLCVRWGGTIYVCKTKSPLSVTCEIVTIGLYVCGRIQGDLGQPTPLWEHHTLVYPPPPPTTIACVY